MSMRPFIQAKGSMPASVNLYAAYLGFQDMGFECDLFDDAGELGLSQRGDVVVGGLGTVRSVLKRFNVPVHEIDYPAELAGFMGRRMWTCTLSELAADSRRYPVFVKPADRKLFGGTVVADGRDLLRLGGNGADLVLDCSEALDFAAEWRCFVRYGEILDVRPYRGDWHAQCDPAVIEAAIRAYANAPAGYAADFGVTRDGRTVLVEITDGYALSGYGIKREQYARLLAARWAELTGTEDECPLR